MIKGYRDRDTEKLARGEGPRRLPPDIQRCARMRLDRIDAAVVLEDLRVSPSHHLEALRGDRAGQHSIRINEQWRSCFEWRDGHAYNVEVVDYH